MYIRFSLFIASIFSKRSHRNEIETEASGRAILIGKSQEKKPPTEWEQWYERGFYLSFLLDCLVFFQTITWILHHKIVSRVMAAEWMICIENAISITSSCSLKQSSCVQLIYATSNYSESMMMLTNMWKTAFASWNFTTLNAWNVL